MDERILDEIEEYRDAHWDEVISDIETLVRIESVEDLASASEWAPYGSGPRRALDQALEIAERMGLEVHDCEGRIGYADLVGASDAQVGIIGHVDVVPAGPGWACEPYAVTRRDGYLLGRGVIDDKGPLMVALHALKFWKDRQGQLPYTVRVLFGANEETNMKDVEYYRRHYDDPAFLFTPDSQFPVGYGESGICSGILSSALIEQGDIVEFQGGQAVNAVPGVAWAIVRSDEKPSASAIETGDVTVQPCTDTHAAEMPQLQGVPLDNCWRVEAKGVSAHAMAPELGRNAIGILVDFLLDAHIGTSEERDFLHLLKSVHDDFDGSGLGVQAVDEHFGPLSVVGGVVRLEDGRIIQSLDFRYPTTITSEQIEQSVKKVARMAGADFTMEHDKRPFLMNPDSAEIHALLEAYAQVTGEEGKGLTSKGGTYARCFTTGVSFGVEKPWVDDPSWVGGMHGPDEGVSEELLKQSFAIYALALGNLAQLSW